MPNATCRMCCARWESLTFRGCSMLFCPILFDNARPHTARISQHALRGEQMLQWPACSPDLLPIEHLWDVIGRRLQTLPLPRTNNQLWQMVEREWRTIPQDTIHTLIDSVPRRVSSCIAVVPHPTESMPCAT
ncbi:transposable element Tc1 transposase [Trichonephila clavipes]|nr:transposable element Tc1 transposase [Trichonephila clavipes]